jgi:hypothetical protein
MPGSTGTSGSTQTTVALNANSGQVFNTLDATHKGFLNPTDVRSNQFLSSNFSKCDTNGDGKLTQSEVTLCMQSAPPGQQ